MIIFFAINIIFHNMNNNSRINKYNKKLNIIFDKMLNNIINN